MEYPIIKAPDSFLATKNHELLYPEKPVVPEEPQKPELLDENEGCLGMISYMMFLPIIMGFFLFFGNLFSGDSEDFGMGALFFFGGLIIFLIFKPSGQNKKSNEERIEKYKREIHKYNTEVLSKYQSEVEVYNEKVRLLNDEVFRNELAKNKLEQGLFKSAKPVLIKNKAKKGVSEELFLKYLKLKFGTRILVGYTIDSSENIYEYIPDFVYYNPKNGLCIDIEIDEPYEGATNEPIHYIGADDSRDNFFLSKNWVIVRFAEEQVIKQPDSCANFIAMVINYYLPNTETISKTEKLSFIKRWTKQEAEIMAFKLYRNTYIPLSSISKLQIENENIKKESEADKNIRAKSDFLEDDDLPF